MGFIGVHMGAYAVFSFTGVGHFFLFYAFFFLFFSFLFRFSGGSIGIACYFSWKKYICLHYQQRQEWHISSLL